MESFFDRVGGQPFFDALVDRFYAGVETDPVLRPLYPADLTDPKSHLALFLGQYWGGPPAYSELRGAPMLRARHLRFPIDAAARDEWLGCMQRALDAMDLAKDDRDELWNYFVQGANFFMNRGGLPISGS